MCVTQLVQYMTIHLGRVVLQVLHLDWRPVIGDSLFCSIPVVLQVLHLDWRPLIRDSLFYALSIGCFIGFAWDGYFEHYEAVILLLLYSLYICLMVVNAKIMDWMGTWKCW